MWRHAHLLDRSHGGDLFCGKNTTAVGDTHLHDVGRSQLKDQGLLHLATVITMSDYQYSLAN